MQIRNWLKSKSSKVMALIYLLSFYHITFADDTNGVIPISNDDMTQGGKNFADTLITIFQKDILPVIEIVGGVWVLYQALSGLWKGYKEYQRSKDMGELKDAVISAVILIVVGGSILYLLDLLRSYTFS